MLEVHCRKFFSLEATGHQALHSVAYALNAFLDAFFFWVGKAETDVLLASPVYMKRFTDDEGYVLFGGFT